MKLVLEEQMSSSHSQHSPVESEEDEVSLVVEGGRLSSYELGVLRKESSEQPADAVPEARGEVVEDHLWGVFCGILTSSLHRDNRYKMMGLHSRAWTEHAFKI